METIAINRGYGIAIHLKVCANNWTQNLGPIQPIKLGWAGPWNRLAQIP